MDITQISESELGNLMSMLTEEMERRRESGRQRVIEELAALAKAHGYTLDTLFGEKQKPAKLKPGPAKGRVVPVKYRHPDHPDLTWTGRGIQPRWVTAWVAEGKALEACLAA